MSEWGSLQPPYRAQTAGVFPTDSCCQGVPMWHKRHNLPILRATRVAETHHLGICPIFHC